MTFAEMKGIKKVARGRRGVIMIRRWMTRRRRKREMAEKLESTALKLEADLQETVDKLKETVLEEEVDQTKEQQTSSSEDED